MIDYDLELRHHIDVLRRSYGIRASDRVLDVGCGTGQTTREAARLATAGAVLGIDRSDAMIERARALAAKGIRVNSIGPGYIETYMTSAVAEMSREYQADHLSRIPMGRLGRPIEVANTALFLACEESSYFTGELLHPDGGIFTG